MILRRAAEHFRKQDWTAIGIVFVLLVLGVFLGIQVSNWNAERHDRALEATYLSSLVEDIRSDVAESEEISRISTQRMAALGYLIRNASGKALPTGFDSARGRIVIEDVPPYDASDPRSIGIAMFILTTLKGNRLTYDTLIDNAGIGVIRDPSLIRAIRAYYAAVDGALVFETEMKQSRVALIDAEQQAGLSPADGMPADEIVHAFAGNPRLLAAARNYWLYTNRHLKLMRELRIEANAMIARIEREETP